MNGSWRILIVRLVHPCPPSLKTRRVFSCTFAMGRVWFGMPHNKDAKPMPLVNAKRQMYTHEEAMDLSPTYRALSTMQQEFVLAWMTAGDVKSLDKVRQEIGCSKIKIHAWRKSEQVHKACRELALQSASGADTILLYCHEHLAVKLFERIVAGDIDTRNLNTFECRLIEGAFRRTGLDNFVTFSMEEGGKTATLKGGLNVVQQAMQAMQDRRDKEDLHTIDHPPSRQKDDVDAPFHGGQDDETTLLD